MSPIVFDEQMNEFHITHATTDDGREGHTLIRHCPWCGGAAPESKRHTYFAQITNEESRRLHVLTANVRTVEEVLAKFGPPRPTTP